jgi:hypothetical protein
MSRRSFAAGVTALLLLGFAREASAQDLLLGASGSAAGGIQGGGAGLGVLERARSRLRLGIDARNSEEPKDIIGFGLLLEVELRGTVGADVRYFRMVDPHFYVDIGVMGYLFPSSLFGATAGLEYRHSLGTKTAFFAGPEVNVFAFGSDLPGGTILWQGLLQAGLHVDL